MGKIKIGRMVLGVYGTNCYFLYRDKGSEVIIIDAPDYGDSICANMEKNGFYVAAVLMTHGHFDHIWGAEKLRRAANESAERRGGQPVKIYACEDERELLMKPEMNVSAAMKRPCKLRADIYVKDGDEFTVADMTFQVIATPGHTAGGCCYYFKEPGFLISGDTLFEESVGRTDFPTGSMGTLVRSIKEKLFVLPDETKVYPGHGDATTIGHEKKYNPFVQ